MDLKPLCLTSISLLLYLCLECFGYTVLPLDRSSCDVLSVFGQASQSGKWLGKASSFISQLVWVLFVLASWTADSLDCSIMSFASDGTATLKRSVCLNPLLYACTHQPPWCCGLWIELYGSVFPFQPPLLLTHDWQTKIIKNNKRPGGLGPAELAPLLSVVAQALALGQLIFIGKARSTEGLEGLYITGCVILTDKPSLTLLLTEMLNYCLCLLFKTTFFAVLFPLDNAGWLEHPW